MTTAATVRAPQDDAQGDPHIPLSGVLARHVAAVGYDDLPGDVVDGMKRLILDTLATGWAGSAATGVGPIGAALAAGQAPAGGTAAGECLLWGTARRAALGDAAFINSAAAAALDYDALHQEALIHSPIVTLPALLGQAERAHLPGKALLCAAVLADDLSYRLGLAAIGHDGWFFTSLFGLFGAAAGMAKLQGLDQEGIAHALGIALYLAGGTQQPMLEKSLIKRFMSGFASRSAVFAAELARAGMSAPRQTFEGRFGLFRLYQACDPQQVIAGLGRRYESANANIKEYPCCGCAHALIDATLRLAEQHSIEPGDVTGARARISPFMNNLIGGRFDPTPADSQIAAQFSGQYAIACALFRRRFALADIQPDQAMEPRVAAFARSVRLEIDPGDEGQLAPAEVTLELRDGRTVCCRVEQFPGGTGITMPRDRLYRKAHDCLQQGERPLKPAQIDHLIERVEQMERLSDCAMLFDGL